MKTKATVWECDGCGRIRVPPTEEDPPLGLHGTVLEATTGGGAGGEWYACSRRCLRRAILTALERGWRR